MNNTPISDNALREMLATTMEIDQDFAPDTIVNNIMQGAFLATLIGSSPTQYLRVASSVLRTMGLRKQADTLKVEYMALVNADE